MNKNLFYLYLEAFFPVEKLRNASQLKEGSFFCKLEEDTSLDTKSHS